MPIYYDVNGSLLSEEEYLNASRDLVELRAGRRRSIALDRGRVLEPSVAPPVAVRSRSFANAGQAEFVDIGFGKPLTVWVASAYAGELPPKGWLLDRDTGGLLTSAVKSWSYQDAQPRALNVIKEHVKRGEELWGAATEHGTPIIFYSPALVDRSLSVTVEMAFDDVDLDVFNSVSKVLLAAGSLPVFAPAAPYLLVAGALLNIGSKLANALFDSKAEFQVTQQINIELPGATAAAGHVLLTRSDLERQTLIDYQIVGGRLKAKANPNASYTGPTPYLVLALDGRADASLEGFSARAASAALLHAFYDVRPGGESPADDLVEALTLFNDFRYHTEALDLKKRLAAQGLGDAEKARLTERYQAVIKNIRTDPFKLN